MIRELKKKLEVFCDFAENNANMYESDSSSSGVTPLALTGIATGMYPFEVGVKPSETELIQKRLC